MGFMNSYKQLDKLCRETNGIGVTGYIQDMEHVPNGAHYVPGWKDDYYNLKHYRHIRNQIAHETDVDENTLCSKEDTSWVDGFYHRIMKGSDPLTLYRKAVKPRPIGKTSPSKVSKSIQYIPKHSHKRKTVKLSAGCVTALLLAIAVFVALLVLFISYFN